MLSAHPTRLTSWHPLLLLPHQGPQAQSPRRGPGRVALIAGGRVCTGWWCGYHHHVVGDVTPRSSLQEVPSWFLNKFSLGHASSPIYCCRGTWYWLRRQRHLCSECKTKLQTKGTNGLQFSHSVMSNSLRPHGLQHAKPPCLSSTPRAYSNSCPLSRWCHPAISSFVIPFNLSQHRGLFQWASSSHQVAKVLEFQLQHQLFQWMFRTDFFRIDWLDLLVVQGALKSLPQHYSSKASILKHSAFFMAPLTSIHDYWKNHSFDYTSLCWQSIVCFLICCLGWS